MLRENITHLTNKQQRIGEFYLRIEDIALLESHYRHSDIIKVYRCEFYYEVHLIRPSNISSVLQFKAEFNEI